jgi:iron(III) transport system ATP-binding protein
VTDGERPRPTAAAERPAEAPDTPGARLAFEGVSRRFGTVQALKDISFSVRPGEILCLLGPSGCGKTTLLRIAAGIERQSSGRVLIDGAEVAGPERFLPPERRRVGLVFQDYALFPHLTILDNVRFGLAGRPAAAAEAAARAALDGVGLGHYADAYPHALSGGEQQRVALARAIVPEPHVLLMDEPFSGLDSRLRDRVRDETVAILRRTGATVVVVTHDPEEAMRIGDRIALLRDGRLVQIGTPEALWRRPADLAAARFFSEVDELPGVARGGAALTPIGPVEVTLPHGVRDGDRLTVAVRPHSVRLAPAADGVATVAARRFLGEVDHLELSVDGLDRPLFVREGRPGRLLPGARVAVSIEPGAALAFPADEGALTSGGR